MNTICLQGVMVAEKDFHAPKHPELETIPNLQVY
jgi:small subunit ribosomal protein S10e